MKKIGAITIGQSPRVDVISDIKSIIQDFELIECGALDNYSYQEVMDNFQTDDNDIFVSRMRDGRQVSLDKNKIIKELNACIKKLENKGCKTIMLFCTGQIKGLESRSNLLQPNMLMHKLINSLAKNVKIAIIIPDIKQKDFIRKQWDYTNLNIEFMAASPYQDSKKLNRLADEIKNNNFRLVYLDCIGYSKKMQQLISEKTGIPVLLPRTLLAEITSFL